MKSFTNLKLVLVLLGGVVLLGGAAGYLWWIQADPEPSTPELTVLEPPVLEVTTDPAVTRVIEEGRAAVRASPRSAPAWGKLGMLFYVHGFPVPADSCFRTAEQLDRGEARWPYFRGILQANSDPEAAIADFQRAVNLCGDNPEAPRLRLAEALLGQAHLDEAEVQFRRVLEHHPDNARALLGLARLASQREQWVQSLDYLNRVASDERTRKAAHLLLAEVHRRLDEASAADQELRRAHSLAKDAPWPDPWNEEAFQLQTGRKAFLIRANVLLEQGQIPEAIVLGRQTVKDYPDSNAAWLILGKALLQQRNFPEAEAALRKVMELAPESVEAPYHLGFAAGLQGNYAAAKDWYVRAVELKPDFPNAYYNLGHCQNLLGDRQAAIVSLRKALACQPDLVEAHVLLAELLAKEGARDEAAKHLRLALQFRPNEAKAKQLLEQVLKPNGSGGP